ncbi:MAG: hypothetical protein ACRDRK_16750 [Pseudonocardia sp.]
MTEHPLTARIADQLAAPEDIVRRYRPPGWWRQSLAAGALSVALLHIERARTERSSWDRAHAWVRLATAGPVDDGPGSHLHHGAPALGFVLHRASTGRPRRYTRALTILDARIAATTRHRLDAAHRRIDRPTPRTGRVRRHPRPHRPRRPLAPA